MKKILIFGSGQHSKVIFSEIMQLKDHRVIGFVDENIKKGKIIQVYKNKKYKIIGNIKSINNLLDKNTSGIIAVGENFKRKEIAKKINKIYKKFNWMTLISKNSIINGIVKIGAGSQIISSVVINTGTKIGKHCLINTSSSIDHDNTFKNFSSTGPGVCTGGSVVLGECSYLGISSAISHNITIESNTVVGAKSLVLKDCKKNSVYFGVPAKKIKERKYNSKYL